MDNAFEKGVILDFAQSVEYAAGGVVSKQVMKNDVGNVTLFSFDAGQGLSEHTAPFDAMVQVLEGEVEIMLAGQPLRVTAGQCVIMPAHVPHALQAITRFKMLLTMIRG